MSIKNLKTVIFGLNDYAQLAHYYLTHDSVYQPIAFCVDVEYKNKDEFLGLPVIDVEDFFRLGYVIKTNLFLPMSAKIMNNQRKYSYEYFKKNGVTFINYISSMATVLTEDIGENNFILENNVIQPFVKIGNNNVFWSGNHIGHHSVIGDHNTFTSHVVLSGHCNVGNNCFFGVNATIRDGLSIDDYSLISQGANLLKSAVPENGVYIGNPAKKLEGKLSYEIF
jgi:sugar O-acyltransferase (sialic acid O-acetyltransferase NeuD family)